MRAVDACHPPAPAFRRGADPPGGRVHHQQRRQAPAPGAGAAVGRALRLSGQRTTTNSPRWSSSSTPPRCCTTTWSTNPNCAAAATPPTPLFGNAASVLVGDFLYSRAFQMMVAVDNMRVMAVLADATNTIAEGEVLQLLNCHDPDIDEDDYLRRDPLQDRQAVRGRRPARRRARRRHARQRRRRWRATACTSAPPSS